MESFTEIASFLFSLCLAITFIHASSIHNQRKPYIVYMGGLPPEVAGVTTTEQHHSLLAEAIGDEELARKAMIHSYRRSLSAFAANILPQEAKRLSEKSSVISVFPNTIRKLLTTRSWDFLGMPLDKTKRNRGGESDMIVATLDTGIYIEAPSFNDEGYGPPPAKWKGKCDNGANFTGCNNKVIGARFYNLDPGEDTVFPSPVDTEGHGTHTASIAAGGAVHGASLYGLARGTARGGVPSARIATYKVCGDLGCPDMNLLAAFDDAIADGVDVISVSISGSAGNFFDDVIAIGSFHAMQKGILTSCAAGNEGPYEGTVQNVAPWILTVAATNMDRQFRTPVKLGNGMKFSGLSINTYPPEKAMYPLISGALAANSSSDPYLNASTCDPGSLSIRKVKGKIVLCLDWSGAGYTVITSGGHGAIIAVDEEEDIAFTTLLPSTNTNTKIGSQIAHYIHTAKKATAVIYKSITMKANAPRIASFSSRGPQFVTRDILKPDIAAPGLDILAGYSKLASITNEAVDQRHMTFNIISGTSMATPHASGAAAYVKSFHPDWSQAAIKSALMTTAKPVIANGSHAPLDSGSGLLNPTAAVHPGLVYDMSLGSYVSYLCKEEYNSTTIGLLTAGKPHLKCSDFPQARGSDGLNYPSMHLQLLADDTDFSTVFHRTVTNVGHGNSTYKATVHAPKGVTVKAIPNRLVFGEQHQKRSFAVVVKGKLERGVHGSVSAVLEWDDSKHIVRSPILIYKPAI